MTNDADNTLQPENTDTYVQEEEPLAKVLQAAHPRARDARNPALCNERLHNQPPERSSCGIGPASQAPEGAWFSSSRAACRFRREGEKRRM